MCIKKVYVSLLLVFLFIIFFVNNVGATQVNIGLDQGLQIFYPEYKYVKLNEPFFLHIHAANITDGKELNNTLADCYLHLYNSTGYHILESQMVKDSNYVDWELYIDGGNFSEMGEHAFRIYCEDTVGGSVGGIFMVNLSGENRNIYSLLSNVFLILFLIGLIYAVSKKYEGIDFEKANQSIIDKGDDHIGKTFIRSFVFGLMKNVFLWYYLIGWVILFILREIIMTFSSLEIYTYFVLILELYSIGFLLVIVFFIGMVKKHFDYVQDIIEDISRGIR